MDVINKKSKDGIVSTFLSMFRTNTYEFDVENNEEYKEILAAEKSFGATKHIEELTKSIQMYSTTDKKLARREVVKKERMRTEKNNIGQKYIDDKSDKEKEIGD